MSMEATRPAAGLVQASYTLAKRPLQRWPGALYPDGPRAYARPLASGLCKKRSIATHPQASNQSVQACSVAALAPVADRQIPHVLQ